MYTVHSVPQLLLYVAVVTECVCSVLYTHIYLSGIYDREALCGASHMFIEVHH